MIKEYQSKWREESVGWPDFVAAFPANKLDIQAAELVQGESSVVFRVSGYLNGDDLDDMFYDVYIRAKEILVKRSHGVEVTVEALMQLGADYWKSFGEKRQ